MCASHSRFAGSLGAGEPKANTEGEGEDEEDEDVGVGLAGAKGDGDDDAKGEGDANEKWEVGSPGASVAGAVKENGLAGDDDEADVESRGGMVENENGLAGDDEADGEGGAAGNENGLAGDDDDEGDVERVASGVGTGPFRDSKENESEVDSSAAAVDLLLRPPARSFLLGAVVVVPASSPDEPVAVGGVKAKAGNAGDAKSDSPQHMTDAGLLAMCSPCSLMTITYWPVDASV